MANEEMNKEFDTSFLNNIQSFDDFDNEEVFSFSSDSDNIETQDYKIDSEQKEDNEFEFPIDLAAEDSLGVTTNAEEAMEEPKEDVIEPMNDDSFKSFDFKPVENLMDNNEKNELESDLSSEIEIENSSEKENDNNKEDDEVLEEKEANVGSTEETENDDFDKTLEELEKNTDLEEKISEDASTDINSLFVKVNSNVKEASDIFLKNVEMKKKIDDRFNELKELQASIEQSKKNDYDEINGYKEKVIKELMDKKDEIEEKLNTLKEMQATFEKEKADFETYKSEEKTKLEDLKREENSTFEAHKIELDNLEDKLRKQKTALEEERRQLSLDQIQYEADKNELANNMLKFNEIVATFTDGMDKLS